MSFVIDESLVHPQNLDVKAEISRLTNLVEGDTDSQALALYQRGVERENQGKMADAIEYYRRAVKLNENVDKLYRGALLKVPELTRTPLVAKVNEKEVEQIDVDALVAAVRGVSFVGLTDHHGVPSAVPVEGVPHTCHEDEAEGEAEGLTASPAMKPLSPLLSLPDDIFLCILLLLIVVEQPAWLSFALTCRKAAGLALERSDCWRQLCYSTYPFQCYEPESMALNGITANQDEMVQNGWNGSWRDMYRQRPFLKVSGAYISVVNYYSEGGKSEGSSAWTNPIRMITYYRYYRFYPDGEVLKLLTSDEPNYVVPRLFREDWKERGLERVRRARWLLSADGTVVITGEGSVDRYTFIEELAIQTSGRWRHHKLAWRSSCYEDKVTGERVPFPLTNEKPFAFSRVKAYR